MFTGIVAGIGRVLAFQNLGHEARLKLEPAFAMANLEQGESIAVNGVCLSVENHGEGSFSVYASRETLEKSNLGALRQGSMVNLERALCLGTRLGGHIVSGHIDCVATLQSITPRGESLGLRFSFPPAFGPFVINKGSVALNGISLTVNDCGADFLEANVIPESQLRTNLLQWRPGEAINMETDIIGKYVHHLLKPWERATGGLNEDFLARHGFI